MELNLDQLGLISYRNGDGTFGNGDSVHDTFTALYCLNVLGEPHPPGLIDAPTALLLLKSADGWPRRSPYEYWWHGRAQRCSRDALTPYLCYSAAYAPGAFTVLLRTLSTKWLLRANNSKPNFRYDTPAEHAARSTPDVSFEPQTQSPDYLGPDIWAICLRGLVRHSKVFALASYLPLCILDLHGLGAAVLQLFSGKTNLRNQALKTHFSATTVPTLVSKATMCLFKLSKPKLSFKVHWTQPGEPRIDLLLAKLF